MRGETNLRLSEKICIIVDDLAKSHRNDAFNCRGAVLRAHIGHAQRAPTMQGAQKLRSAAHLLVRRRWTFYETLLIEKVFYV